MTKNTPAGYGVCPACKGTCRQPADAYDRVTPGYDEVTHTVPCTNCGGQYQGGMPTGYTKLLPSGQACLHSYDYETTGRSTRQYVCDHCGDTYRIFSGD